MVRELDGKTLQSLVSVITAQNISTHTDEGKKAHMPPGCAVINNNFAVFSGFLQYLYDYTSFHTVHWLFSGTARNSIPCPCNRDYTITLSLT